MVSKRIFFKENIDTALKNDGFARNLLWLLKDMSEFAPQALIGKEEKTRNRKLSVFLRE